MSDSERVRLNEDPFEATAGAPTIDGLLRSIRASVGPSSLSDTSARILLTDAAGKLRSAGQVGTGRLAGRRRSARRREVFEMARPVTIRPANEASRSVRIFPLSGADRTLGVAEVDAPSEALERRGEMVELAVDRAAAELGRMIERDRADRAVGQTRAVRSLASELLSAPTSVAAVRRVAALCHRELGAPVAGAIPDRAARGWFLAAFAGVGSRRRTALRAALSRISSDERDLSALRSCFANVMSSEHVVAMRAGPAVLFAEADASATELLASAASMLDRTLEQRSARAESRDTIGIEWAAHELRGPLLASRAAIEQVIGAPTNKRNDSLLSRTREELDRLAGLVDSLLEWAAGSGRVVPCPEEVVRIVREAVREASAGTAKGRVHVHARGPIIALVDSRHLRGAIAKILENSLAYSPSGTRVDVVIEREGSDVTIRIRDRGPGVPAEEQELIFEPLARGSSGSRRRAGHGLGLFIARRVIEAHGGSISLGAATRGAEFSIRLPIGDDAITAS